MIYSVAILGLALRLGLLYLGHDHQGHWTADTWQYIGLSKLFLPGHDISLFAFHFPPGFPLMLLPFNLFGESFWVFSAVMAVVSVWFAYWFAKKTTAFWPVFLFLLFDPVFMSQSVLVSSDFIGMVIFTGAILALTKKPANIYLSGVLWVLSMFFRPVYLWAPIISLPFIFWLFKKSKFKWTYFAGFLLAIYLPVLAYCEARNIENGFFSFSGHNTFQFSKHVVGRILTVVQGTGDAANNEQLAVDAFNKEQSINPRLDWEVFGRSIISQHPTIFAKIVAFSAFRCAFGNANMEFLRLMFAGQHQSPGLWAAAASKDSFFERLKSLNFFYVFGAVIEIILHLILFYWAFRSSKFRSLESIVVYGSLWLLVFYFIFCPVVFGETRLFLPGTIILLLCSAYPFEFNKSKAG